jgi:signal peptidase I
VDAPGEILEEQPQPERTYKRLWCAMASAVIPGLGDWILGARKRGGLFFALFATLLVCYWPLRLPRIFLPFFAMILAGMLLNVASASCTFLCGRSDKDAAANWWILVLIPLAFFSVSIMELQGVLHASGFRVFATAGQSMEPTLNPGDDIVVDTWYFQGRKPQAGEVVVFRHRGLYLVKRIVATGGATIEGVNDHVEINNRTVAEPYIVHRDVDHPPDERDNFGPFRIGDGEIFVMGDDRDYSLDSRIRSGEYDYGPVFVTDVVGKPLYRFKRSMSGSPYDGQPVR